MNEETNTNDMTDTSVDNNSADNTSAENTTPTDRSKVILETPVCRTVSIISFTLRVIDLVFGESVRFAIILECKCNEQIYTEYKELSIVGDEYRGWGTDDEYMINLVKSKLPTLV
jgi:hypothetical protein